VLGEIERVSTLLFTLITPQKINDKDAALEIVSYRMDAFRIVVVNLRTITCKI
jgi:hypothetical protein